MRQQEWTRRANLTRMAAVVCALGTGHAGAGGLLAYEISTPEIGLASAGYGARAQDASTVMSNPAGMTRLEGTQVQASATAIYGDIRFSPGATAAARTVAGGDGGNSAGWMPTGGMFVSYSVSRDVKLGLGFGGNFGGSTKYSNDWTGRYYSQESTLLGLSILPSVAVRVNDKLSLGASLNAMYGISKTVVAVNNIAPGFGDGQLTLEDRKWGYGVNLGMLYEASSATRFSLTYNSEIKLDFSPSAQFSGIAPGLNALLIARGLPGATVNIGMKVPQGVMGSMFHQVDRRWAVLASLGWQQWSRFGQVGIGVESSAPSGTVSTNLNMKDTWHGALGAQYRPGGPWTYSFGVAYDSKFQDNNNVSPTMPVNSAWRFGVGAQNETSKSFSWGVAAAYVYGGSLNVNKTAIAPVAIGGRGDLVGSYNNTSIFFISANANWKF